MSVLTLFGLQILIYAAFPFYLATLKRSFRAAAFYILISIYLVIGGFLGSVYSFPVTDTINISGGNLAYGALMMTTILFVIIEKDISVLRNTIRLVFWVNVFKVLFFSTISWALQNEAVINPNNTSFAVFRTSVFFTILGGALIILELFIFTLIFEQLKKRITNVYVLAILYTLVFFLVLCLDGVLFPTIAFGFSPQLVNIVIGGVRGKLYMASAYSIPILIFMFVFRNQLTRFFEEPILLIDLWRAPKEELIAEIQRHQEELALSAKRYRGVVEDTPVLICSFLPGGEITFANNAYCEYFAKTPDELVGTTFQALIPESDRETVMANIADLTVESPTQSHEHQVIVADNEIRWQRWINRALFDSQGKATAYQSIGEDITESKKADEKLRRAYREWEDIFQAIGHPTVILDRNRKITAANRATLSATGQTEDEIIGKRCFEIFHGTEDSQPPDCCPFHDITASGDLETAEMEVEALGGWHLVSCTPVLDDEGQLEKVIHITTDITERKLAERKLIQHQDGLEQIIAERTLELSEQVSETDQLNEALSNLLEDFQTANETLEKTTWQLQESNQELEAFTYSVSHDLRAPLRAVDGFSQILLEDYVEQIPSEAVRYLDKVSEGAQHMGTLIQDLLDLSRLGRKSLQKSLIEPGVIVEQALKELASDLEGRTIEIEVGNLPSCQADPSLMKQVYINLIGNALKFSAQREDAKIEIGWTDADDEGVYFIKDNGVGFDMEYADKLFGVFQRLHPMEQFEGTGVGLAIVQRIIRRHGGRVWAEAEIDEGATFYFTIPKEDEV